VEHSVVLLEDTVYAGLRVNLTIFGGTGASNRGSWIAATMAKIGSGMCFNYET
jgi:hypothetical protein